MKRELETAIISRKLKALKRIVEYYKTAFLPDVYEYTGSSKADLLRRAEKELDKFQSSVNTYYSTGNFDLLDISENEKANYLIQYAEDCYNLARDYTGNVFIVSRNLRRCVQVRQECIKIYPQLETYSNRAFALGYRMSI